MKHDSVLSLFKSSFFNQYYIICMYSFSLINIFHHGGHSSQSSACLSFTSEGIKRNRKNVDISSCSFVILEIEGQVERNALWDKISMQCALFNTADFGNALCFISADFGHAVDHPDIPSTQKICILHTRTIIWGRTTGKMD